PRPKGGSRPILACWRTTAGWTASSSPASAARADRLASRPLASGRTLASLPGEPGRTTMRIAFLAAALLAAAATAAPSLPARAQQPAPVDPAADASLKPVLAHERRADDRARDAHRHPAETLAFFGVKPGMTVVDYLPAGGWYTRILVPYLGPQG